MTTPTPETPASHDCATCPDCIHDGHKCCGCYDGDCCQAAETPAGGLTTETRDEWAGVLMRRWGVGDGDQDAYDAACADVDALAPLAAAAVVQARAEAWDEGFNSDYEGDGWPPNPYRAALPATEDGDTR